MRPVSEGGSAAPGTDESPGRVANAAKSRVANAAASKSIEAIVTLLRSAGGKLALVGAFTALLAMTGAQAWPAVGLALVLTSFLPQHRRVLLAVATAAVVAVSPPVDLEVLNAIATARGGELMVGAWPLVVIATLAFGCFYAELVRRFPKSLLGRHPVLVLLLLLTVLLVAAGDLSLTGGPGILVTTAAMTLGSYVWFFAYAAAESRAAGATPALQQLGFWRPFWGFSNVPLGKGAAYLGRVEARDADALAFTQLAGLRLMVWAVVLTFAMDAFQRALYAPHGGFDGAPGLLTAWLPPEGLPRLAVVIERQALGEPFPFATRWASVLAEFVLSVLHMMTWGHPIIATCRMAGFHAAPNTDRALLSTSVAEFYNRFYFYFKELLATFFFYPTFLTFFRKQPKLRLFTATLLSAGFGNFLFHFYRDSAEIFRLGYLDALVAYHVYGCYALLLGVSIAVSQARLQARHRRRPEGALRVLAIAGVLFYYCLLNVLDARTPYPIREYAALYVSLVIP